MIGFDETWSFLGRQVVGEQGQRFAQLGGCWRYHSVQSELVCDGGNLLASAVCVLVPGVRREHVHRKIEVHPGGGFAQVQDVGHSHLASDQDPGDEGRRSVNHGIDEVPVRLNDDGVCWLAQVKHWEAVGASPSSARDVAVKRCSDVLGRGVSLPDPADLGTLCSVDALRQRLRHHSYMAFAKAMASSTTSSNRDSMSKSMGRLRSRFLFRECSQISMPSLV